MAPHHTELVYGEEEFLSLLACTTYILAFLLRHPSCLSLLLSSLPPSLRSSDDDGRTRAQAAQPLALLLLHLSHNLHTTRYRTTAHRATKQSPVF